MIRGILYLFLLLTFYEQQVAAFDSEVVEAATPDRHFGTRKPAMEVPQWQPNDMIIVKPYNILEANCPQGYVLANKHCHKRVRGATTMKKIK